MVQIRLLQHLVHTPERLAQVQYRQLQPMLHAVALHQDLFGLQRRQGVLLHHAQNQFEQHLQLVAVQNDQSGAQGVGHGQVAKLCNQIAQVINIQGVAESLRFAQANGADLQKVFEAISGGMAGSRMLDLMGPKMVSRDFKAGIEARLHAKDFFLVKDAATKSHLDMPALQTVAVQLEKLMASGWGYDDTSSLLKVLEA